MLKSLSVVICTLNSQYIHSSLAPWCLLSGIKTYCQTPINARVVEGTINEKLENAAQRILECQPDLIGFCCYIWNITQTTQLIRLIKEKLPHTTIVLGGPEVSYNADRVLSEEPLVDYIVSGEGEKPFALLIDAVCSGKRVTGIPGLCYRDTDKIITAAPNTPGDEPPSPYTKEYLNSLKGRIAYLESSRGCPFSCAFCLSGRCGGARFYPMDRAKNELLLLANSGTQTVKLVDRTFNANRKRAIELFRFIIENYGIKIPKGVCFHFEIAGDLLDDETIELLGKAPTGSIQLEIGLQSFNPKALEAIHRKTNVERLKNNILRLTANGNIHIHIDLIAGLPYEDWNSFANSFNIAYSLHPNMLQLGFLKLLHGAPMREQPEEYPCRFDEHPPYEVLETPWISSSELAALHHMEDAVERLANSGRFRRTLDYLLQQCRITPFNLFCQFGEYAAQKSTQGISLDDYCTLVFEYFSSKSSVDKTVLRDRMVCDRIATNSSGKLPPALYIKDSRLKKAIIQYEQEQKNRPTNGIKRTYAILYSEKSIVFADYQDKNPVTGEFILQKIPLKIQ